VFWSSLIKHIEQDCVRPPRAILDIGCHTGGLLYELNCRFAPAELIGIEPIASARAAATRLLADVVAEVRLLDKSEWDRIPVGSIDLVTSHETLYLEPDLQEFMNHLRRILDSGGAAYVVLGCHSENPLWETWKLRMIAAGHRVFSHAPIQIMEAAASAGFLPAVQPLRRSGWVTYDPRGAEFTYPDARTMLDHHYRHKLIFRLRIADVPTATS
jgi:SAM-dependent methyltransferase